MKIKAILLATCFFAAQTAFAQEFGDWTVSGTPQGGIALVTNASGSSLEMVCVPTACELYLVTRISCVPRNTYPFMVNTNSGVTFTRAVCEYIPNVGLAFKLEDWKQVVPSLIRDTQIGFAAALQSGRFAVSHFSLIGSAAALNALTSHLQPSSPVRSRLHDSIM